MTKLIFTLRLMVGQVITVGGCFQRPKSHLGSFSLLHYWSHVATGLSFFHIFLFHIFPFLFYFIALNSALFLLLLSTTRMDSDTFSCHWCHMSVSPHSPFLSAFLNVPEGLCQVRPSQEKSGQLASYSRALLSFPLQHAVCSLTEVYFAREIVGVGMEKGSF